MGSGTTAVAAKRCGRNYVGFELNSDYCGVIEKRLAALDTATSPVQTKPDLQPTASEPDDAPSQTSLLF
jgi:site-specific DNA-methyltransferase (adenine-specific)